jgi:hypothetical protein
MDSDHGLYEAVTRRRRHRPAEMLAVQGDAEVSRHALAGPSSRADRERHAFLLDAIRYDAAGAPHCTGEDCTPESHDVLATFRREFADLRGLFADYSLTRASGPTQVRRASSSPACRSVVEPSRRLRTRRGSASAWLRRGRVRRTRPHDLTEASRESVLRRSGPT